MSTVRRPGWEGARNLADLGGLPLSSGGETAYGVVLRAAATEWWTTRGWEEARAAGLSRIVDLRNAAERERGPQHPEVDPSAAAGVEVVHAPTEDPDDPVFLEQCGHWLDHPQSWAPNLALYPEKVSRVLTAVADAAGPVLVHCAGGRDRTGMVTSMLLALAGATPDAICANYEDGFRGAAAHRGHGLAYDPDGGGWVIAQERDWSADELDAAIADRLPVLREWVATTDVAAYLLDAGLDAGRVDRLRRMLRS